MNGSILKRATDLSLLKTVHSALSPHDLQINGYQVSYHGVKGPGRDADHSPGSRAEVNNMWS
jgi:hypothetical protein